MHRRRLMQQHTTRVNPSDETIKIGPLGIRFLLTGEDSHGSASVFEVRVPAGQKLAAPAHKNDAYEEIVYGIEGVLTWTVDGTPIEVGPGQALCIARGAVHRFEIATSPGCGLRKFADRKWCASSQRCSES